MLKQGKRKQVFMHLAVVSVHLFLAYMLVMMQIMHKRFLMALCYTQHHGTPETVGKLLGKTFLASMHGLLAQS